MTEQTTTDSPITALVNHPIASEPKAFELIAAAATVPEKIEDEETAADAADLVKAIRACDKNLEDGRKAIVGPINQGVKQLNARFKMVSGPLGEAMKRVNGKLTAYQLEQDRLVREAEEAAQAARAASEAAALAEAQRLEDEGNKAGAEKALEYAVATPAPVVSRQPIIRGDGGSAMSLRTDWKWEVSDKAQIPLEHMAPDAKVIDQLVKSGTRAIPGLRIFSVKTTVVR